MKLFNIPLRFHFSYFILVIIGTVVGFDIISLRNMDMSLAISLVSALLFPLMLTGLIIIHELAHSLTARRYGIEPESITLFLLGGVAKIDIRQTQNPKENFWIIAAGPLSNFILTILGIVIIIIYKNLEPVIGDISPEALISFFDYHLINFIGVNISFAVFNLIPAYPLDGGRMMHSITWKISGNKDKGMILAANIGKIVVFIMMSLAIYCFLVGVFNLFDVIWLFIIGWFLIIVQNAEIHRIKEPQQ